MSNTLKTESIAPDDLHTFQTCLFLVNVVSEMYDQWVKAGKPNKNDFSWGTDGKCKPIDCCPITQKQGYRVTDFYFDSPLWSTFSLTKKEIIIEPFGSLVTDSQKKITYLVFRGTKNYKDGIIDLERNLTCYQAPTENPPSGMEVETGFYKVYQGLDSLTEKLAQIKSPLVITGHSLGAALATLTVPLAVSHNLEVKQYNSGSPRVGNKQFAQYYESLQVETFRLVNLGDPVPKFPSAKWGDYQPVGEEVDFTADYDKVDHDIDPLLEANNHDPCCSYSYAIFNLDNPQNPNFDQCSEAKKSCP